MTRLTELELKAAMATHEYEVVSGSTNSSVIASRDSAASWTVEGKPNKLRNVPTMLDGIKFASKAEVKRYIELLAMERAGLIADLRLQPKYRLFDKFTDNFGRNYRAAHYIGDFAYVQGKQTICEDCKGHPTAKWVLQWKLAIRAYPNVKFEVVKK